MMKNLVILLIVAGLVSSAMGALGSAIVEYNFMYETDGATVVTDGDPIAPGNWTATDNLYDSAGVQNASNVPGYVAAYQSYSTAGLPAGMDGYALNGGAVYIPDAAVANTGNGFTVMTRVNLLNAAAHSNWSIVIGRPTDYLFFLNPEGDLNLWVDGIGDIWGVKENIGVGTDTWMDLAFTFDGIGDGVNADTFSVYVNGQLAYSDTQITAINGGDVEHLGSNGGGGQRFGGMIDYYAYYDGVATADEIKAMAVIPEPATMILLGLGGLVLRRKR